jgi:3-dehydroquinate synthase
MPKNSTFVGMNLSKSLYSGEKGWSGLHEIAKDYSQAGIFILVDENTLNYCLPVLKAKCPLLSGAFIIQASGGEANKTISGVEKIWQMLTQGKAMRNSLLICLGGGVITDIGGFAAATYKRGMDFLHIPTTVLAMVDAAIGGKTGVNLDSVKNQVGTFAQPKSIFVFTEFLETLPKRQMLSGYAEMLKHALTDSPAHFDDLLKLNSPFNACIETSIFRSAAVKTKVVEQDPSEGGIRKVLNFGHTIGHAIEAFSQKNDADPLLHGEAVAIGLVCESYISSRMFNLPQSDLHKIAAHLKLHFKHYPIVPETVAELIMLMYHDKKKHGFHNFEFFAY